MAKRRGGHRRRQRGRLAALTLGAGVAVVVVFALVFSISFGSRGVAAHAAALHGADEALRAATVARAQAGIAAHLAVLERDFDFDAAAQLEPALLDVRHAIADLAASLDDLDAASGSTDAAIESAAAGFRSTVVSIAEAVENGRVDDAVALASADLDRDFRSLTGALEVERDHRVAQVSSAGALMGRIGDVARFLGAFLVPTAAILVYRGLARRQQRHRELELRLETEQELGRARDEFVANASHELRTPLTSILGLAHLLEEDADVIRSAGAIEMTGMIISEANDLARMVDDLLTTARLDAGALHYQFENLSVLDEVGEVVGPIRRAGVDIGVTCLPALVRADRLRLRQVIRNLVSNARKYGGPQIRLVGLVAAGWYEIRVEDDGDGISEELGERLFQRFLHHGDTPSVLGSVGLGLSIVRALTEGMGGAVWYERRQGWTSFVVRMPLADSTEPVAHPEPVGPSRLASGTH